MLLPSAFPIDTFRQSHRPACISTPPPPSSPGGFISLSSCRALQAILGSRPASPLPFTLSTAPKPIKEKTANYGTRNEQPQRPPLQPVSQNIKVPTRTDIQSHEQTRRPPASEPRRIRKRTRADFETPDENDRIPGVNNENESGKIGSNHFSFPHYTSTTTYPPPPPLYRDQNQDRDTFSTPKRSRRIPLLMPLGLSASDFEGLDPTPKAHSKPCVVEDNIHLPPTITGTTPHAASITDEEWSTGDDRLLVSTVLDKLNLSRKVWNECGRKNIEKDGDSLGKRWRVLVRDRECEAGLRRGSGGRCRGELREDWRA